MQTVVGRRGLVTLWSLNQKCMRIAIKMKMPVKVTHLKNHLPLKTDQAARTPKVGSKRSRCEDEDLPPLAIVVKARLVKLANSTRNRPI